MYPYAAQTAPDCQIGNITCLVWAVGLSGIGWYQQSLNENIFEDLYFSVFYNPLGHL